MGQGLYVTAMGMGIVFLSLAILLFAIMALDRLFPARQEKAGQASQPAESPAPTALPMPEAHPVASPSSPDGSFEAVIAGRRYAVEHVESPNGSRQVVVDGARHEVSLGESPSGNVVIDGRSYRAEVLSVRSGVMTVRVEGATFEVEIPQSEAPVAIPAPAVEQAVGEPVLAPLPGRILRVVVALGSRVEQGQELCVLEAMKMENSIRSPRDGVVLEIGAAAGQTVSAGETLLILGGTQ